MHPMLMGRCVSRWRRHCHSTAISNKSSVCVSIDLATSSTKDNIKLTITNVQLTHEPSRAPHKAKHNTAHKRKGDQSILASEITLHTKTTKKPRNEQHYQVLAHGTFFLLPFICASLIFDIELCWQHTAGLSGCRASLTIFKCSNSFFWLILWSSDTCMVWMSLLNLISSKREKSFPIPFGHKLYFGANTRISNSDTSHFMSKSCVCVKSKW